MITDTDHVNSQFSSCQSWYVTQAVKAAAEHWTKTVSNQLVSLCEADLNIKTQLTQFSLHSFSLSVRKYEDLISCHFITASVMQNDLFVVHLQVCVVWLQHAHSILLPPCKQTGFRLYLEEQLFKLSPFLKWSEVINKFIIKALSLLIIHLLCNNWSILKNVQIVVTLSS